MQRELNHGPLDLQSHALPLSYTPLYDDFRILTRIIIRTYFIPPVIRFEGAILSKLFDVDVKCGYNTVVAPDCLVRNPINY